MRVTFREACEFLGLSEDAQRSEFESAFRRMALKYHPDKGGSEGDFKHLQACIERVRRHFEAPSRPAPAYKGFGETESEDDEDYYDDYDSEEDVEFDFPFFSFDNFMDYIQGLFGASGGRGFPDFTGRGGDGRGGRFAQRKAEREAAKARKKTKNTTCEEDEAMKQRGEKIKQAMMYEKHIQQWLGTLPLPWARVRGDTSLTVVWDKRGTRHPGYLLGASWAVQWREAGAAPGGAWAEGPHASGVDMVDGWLQRELPVSQEDFKIPDLQPGTKYLVRTRPLYRVPDDWEFAGMVNVPKSASWSETLTVSTTGVARSAAQAPAAGAAAGQAGSGKSRKRKEKKQGAGNKAGVRTPADEAATAEEEAAKRAEEEERRKRRQAGLLAAIERDYQKDLKAVHKDVKTAEFKTKAKEEKRSDRLDAQIPGQGQGKGKKGADVAQPTVGRTENWRELLQRAEDERKKHVMGEEAFETARHIAELNRQQELEEERQFQEQLRQAAEESKRQHEKEMEWRRMANLPVPEGWSVTDDATPAAPADPPHHIDPALVEEDRRAREAAGGWQTQPQQPYAPASQAASARATQPPAGAAKPGSGAGVGAYPSASSAYYTAAPAQAQPQYTAAPTQAQAHYTSAPVQAQAHYTAAPAQAQAPYTSSPAQAQAHYTSTPSPAPAQRHQAAVDARSPAPAASAASAHVPGYSSPIPTYPTSTGMTAQEAAWAFLLSQQAAMGQSAASQSAGAAPGYGSQSLPQGAYGAGGWPTSNGGAGDAVSQAMSALAQHWYAGAGAATAQGSIPGQSSAQLPAAVHSSPLGVAGQHSAAAQMPQGWGAQGGVAYSQPGVSQGVYASYGVPTASAGPYLGAGQAASAGVGAEGQEGLLALVESAAQGLRGGKVESSTVQAAINALSRFQMNS